MTSILGSPGSFGGPFLGLIELIDWLLARRLACLAFLVEGVNDKVRFERRYTSMIRVETSWGVS